MSRYFYIDCEDYLDLEAFHLLVQKHLGYGTKLRLKLRDEGYGGQFYIEGQSTRGIEVDKEGDRLRLHVPLLADYADFFLAKLFLDIFHQFLSAAVLDEDGDEVVVREHFSDENIQQLREMDSRVFLVMLKNMTDSITLAAPVAEVVFGKVEAEHFIQCQLDAMELTQRLTSYIGGCQWGESEDAGEGDK